MSVASSTLLFPCVCSLWHQMGRISIWARRLVGCHFFCNMDAQTQAEAMERELFMRQVVSQTVGCVERLLQVVMLLSSGLVNYFVTFVLFKLQYVFQNLLSFWAILGINNNRIVTSSRSRTKSKFWGRNSPTWSPKDLVKSKVIGEPPIGADPPWGHLTKCIYTSISSFDTCLLDAGLDVYSKLSRVKRADSTDFGNFGKKSLSLQLLEMCWQHIATMRCQMVWFVLCVSIFMFPILYRIVQTFLLGHEFTRSEIGAVLCFFGRSVWQIWLIEWLMYWIDYNAWDSVDGALTFSGSDDYSLWFSWWRSQIFYRTWWEAGMCALIEPLTFEMNTWFE